jgi:hypothetical protein
MQKNYMLETVGITVYGVGLLTRVVGSCIQMAIVF